MKKNPRFSIRRNKNKTKRKAKRFWLKNKQYSWHFHVLSSHSAHTRRIPCPLTCPKCRKVAFNTQRIKSFCSIYGCKLFSSLVELKRSRRKDVFVVTKIATKMWIKNKVNAKED